MSEKSSDKIIKSITDIAVLSFLVESDNYVAQLCEKLPLNSQTLYSAMKKMELKKLVSSYWQEGEVGGRRHMYSVTKAGKDYYEQNKVEFDYKMLSLLHKQKKEESQTERKIYIPIDMSDKDTGQNADPKNILNLPLSKNKNEKKIAEEIKTEEKQELKTGIAAETKNEIKSEIKPETLENANARPTETAADKSTEIAADKSTETAADKSKENAETQNNNISPYISPNSTIHYTRKQPQQATVQIKDTLTLDLEPLLKPNAVKKYCGFLLFNRLRLFAGAISVIFIALTYLFLSLNIKNTTVYTIGFEVLACYLVVILSVWLILPKNKKEISVGKFIVIRLLVSAVALFTVWAVYLLSNSSESIWVIVPAVFCLLPVLEGLMILSFKKTKWFIC
jgi:DNA-binding PadR family transcriptional regulator